MRRHWFYILLSLAERDRHGSAIMRDVLELTDGALRLWPVTLYGTLDELHEQGLIRALDHAPADAEEMRRLMPATVEHPGPIYIRLGKGGEPIVTNGRVPFNIGKAIAMKEGSDALIVSTGVMLGAAHGVEMEALLVDELARARRPIDRVSVRLGAFADLARRVPYEHWRRRGRPTLQPRVNRMPSVFADLRFALRASTRQPAATALVIATLALAVAANTAVFALVDAVFFRSLPYPHASRLVDLNEQAPKWNLEFVGITYYDFDQWQKNSRVFEGMAVWDGSAVNISDGTTATRVDGQMVSYDMARVLGITPVLGRTFTKDEHALHGPRVVMLGYGMWQSRFAGAHDVIGKTLRIDSRPFTIVGVLPDNVTLTEPTGFWLPLQLDARRKDMQHIPALIKLLDVP